MTKKRLDELLAKYEPRLAARFRSLMARVRGRRSAAELEVMIERGASSEVISTILDDIDASAQVLDLHAERTDSGRDLRNLCC